MKAVFLALLMSTTALAQSCLDDQCDSDLTSNLQTRRLVEGENVTEDFLIKDKCSCSAAGYADSTNGLPKGCKADESCGRSDARKYGPYCTCSAMGGNTGCVMSRCTDGSVGAACDGAAWCAEGNTCNMKTFECQKGGTPGLRPRDNKNVDDSFWGCDRECRWYMDSKMIGYNAAGIQPTPGTVENAFFNRYVQGEEVRGDYCKCYNNGIPITFAGWDVEKMTETWDAKQCAGNGVEPNGMCNKEFQTKTTWALNYATTLVCAMHEDGTISTLENADLAKEGDTILHCGACAACSSLQDMDVIWRTKESITTDMTKCSAAFANSVSGAMPWNEDYQDLDRLITCLSHASIPINFTTTKVAWTSMQTLPAGTTIEELPSCMDCWTDNIMNDVSYCSTNLDCVKKFIASGNSGALEGCTYCDEVKSGPQFIKCAGSNRRSSGITSDIERGSNQICSVGYYYGQ